MARIDRSLLTFLGILIAHEAAYLTSSLFGYENSVAHGHLKTAWLFGSVALLGVLTRSVVRSLRRRRHIPLHPGRLAASIGGGYLIVEQAERLIDGYSALDLFGEPVLWVGLAIAPLVAVLLTRSLSTFEVVTARLVGTDDLSVEPAVAVCTLWVTSRWLVSNILLSSSVSRRGPPFALSFH